MLVLPSFAASGDRMYTRAGRLIDLGGRAINMYCLGSGSPVVVFDSGWGDWSPAWAVIQPQVAKWTRACTYDRAGAGFSDPGPLPRTTIRVADELHEALHAALIRGPFVLVGHSFGSFNMRMFADRYMRDVAGLVLVDGSDDDLQRKRPGEIAAARREYRSTIATLRQCARAVEQHWRQLAPSCFQQFYRGLPERQFSQELNATLLAQVHRSAQQYIASASEYENFAPGGRTIHLLQIDRKSFGSRPVRILTALNHFGDTAKTPAKLHAKHAQYERDHLRSQMRFRSLSTDSAQFFAPSSGHYIQFDDPQLVLRAIGEVVRHVRGYAHTGPS